MEPNYNYNEMNSEHNLLNSDSFHSSKIDSRFLNNDSINIINKIYTENNTKYQTPQFIIDNNSLNDYNSPNKASIAQFNSNKKFELDKIFPVIEKKIRNSPQYSSFFKDLNKNKENPEIKPTPLVLLDQSFHSEEENTPSPKLNTQKSKNNNLMFNLVVNFQNINIKNQENIVPVQENIVPVQEKNKVKERFRLLYLKIKVILLFTYILKYIKYYGVNILHRDIKDEVDLLSYVKVQNPNNKTSLNICQMKGLMPDSFIASIWNIVVMVLLIYTATFMPYIMCFYDQLDVGTFWYYVEIIVDVLFILDLLMNFILVQFDKKNQMILLVKDISLNYLKGWFIFDLAASFPFQFILSSSNSSSSSSNNSSSLASYNKLIRLTRLPRIYRIIKIFRLVRFFKIFRRSKYIRNLMRRIKLSSGGQRQIVGFMVTLLGCHIFSCLFFLIGKIEDNAKTWILTYGLLDQDPIVQYLHSMYFSLFTLTTVGFGNITATTNLEYVIVCFWMIGSYCTFCLKNRHSLLQYCKFSQCYSIIG